MSDDEKTKRHIRKALEKGATLRFAWDAGGDETPIWQEETGCPLDDETRKAVISAIICELQLPGAGEHYHKGSGELFFTPQDALAIRFTGEEYSSCYSGPALPWNALMLRVEDHGNLKAYLPRGQVNVRLTYDFTTGWQFEVAAWISEGDAPELSPEAEACYTGLLRPLLEPYVARFGPKEEGVLGGNVVAYFQVVAGEEVEVNLEPDYRWIENHVDKEIILIP